MKNNPLGLLIGCIIIVLINTFQIAYLKEELKSAKETIEKLEREEESTFRALVNHADRIGELEKNPKVDRTIPIPTHPKKMFIIPKRQGI